MNLQDQVLYRCIHAACARPLPRRVDFCPYCGTGQHADAVRPVSMAKQPETVVVPPAPPPPEPLAAPAPASAPLPPPVAVPSPPPPPAAIKPAVRAGAAAPPPRPKPIRLRYWLIALGMLAMIWFYAKPDSKKIEARVENAIALSRDCKAAQAQAELIALRQDKATPEQLQRVQAALNSADAACEKKRVRAKAWSDTESAVENALDAGDPERALVRLGQFTKRYGENAETRALKSKITARRDAEKPTARPAPAPGNAQSSRNLIAEAEREIAKGNYKAASDKLETCVAMIENNRECIAYKVHADRLLRDMQRCQAAGKDWSSQRCL